MNHNTFSEIELGPALIIVFAILICFIIILRLVNKKLKASDDSKPLLTSKVRILEKPIDQSTNPLSGIAWYVVETDSGERLRLRNHNAKELVLTVGDVGIATYRGQTLESFKFITDNDA